MKNYSPQELRAAAVFAAEELVNLNVFLAEHEKVEAKFLEHMLHVETLLGKGLDTRAGNIIERFALPMIRLHPMLRCYPRNLSRLVDAQMALGMTREAATALCFAPEPVPFKKPKEPRYTKERLYGYRLPTGTA